MSTDNASLPDLVCDNKIETSISGDVVKHILDQPGRSANERRVRREERWVKQKLLGQGTYGAVYLQKRQDGGPETFRAVKEIRKCVTQGKDLEYMREIEAIMKFSHPKYQHCFVNSQGWYEDEYMVYITMQFMELGDLQHYLIRALPEQEARQISAQVLEGLVFMHENGFIHRDLKPANIMVVSKSPNWVVKIADFGISKRRHRETNTNLTLLRGTLGFAAPEAIDPLSECSSVYAMDMWSLGAVTYRILANKTLFEGLRDLMLYAYGTMPFPQELPEFKAISSDGQDFIASLMHSKPEDRMSAASATKHPWLASYLEAQSHVTQACDFTGTPETIAWENMESTTPKVHRTEEHITTNTDSERTIRPFCYSNYKAPFVSHCAEEYDIHGGQKLPIDSSVVLDGPFKENGDNLAVVQSTLAVASKDPNQLDNTVDEALNFRYCVGCLSEGFEFESPILQCGHVICFPCFNRELKLAMNNPQNVTHKCCISGTLYPQRDRVLLNQTLRNHINPESGSSTSRANGDKTAIDCHTNNSDADIERDCGKIPAGNVSPSQYASSDGSKIDSVEHDYGEWPESESNDWQPSPALSQENPFENNHSENEDIGTSSSESDSDAEYDSEETASMEAIKPGPTSRIFTKVTCNTCSTTWECPPPTPIGPFERLLCQHYICHACLLQFLALSLISPKYLKPRCCDHPKGEISEYCWRNIIVDPRINIAWERVKQLDKDWICPRMHPPKDGSLLVTNGLVPIWKPVVNCSGCLTELLPKSHSIRHTDFCTFCSEIVGSNGCSACNSDSIIWNFISRLKKSGAFDVPRIAGIITEACYTENMKLGRLTNYKTLKDLRLESPKAKVTTPDQPAVPQTSNTDFQQPPTVHPSQPYASPTYYPQNPSYSQPQPPPNYSPHGQNFNYCSPLYPASNGIPHNWAQGYPSPHAPFNFNMQGQRTYPQTPYFSPGHSPMFPANLPTSTWQNQSYMISCYRCSKHNMVDATSKSILCTCGARQCIHCHGPLDPCIYGCVWSYNANKNELLMFRWTVDAPFLRSMHAKGPGEYVGRDDQPWR